MDNDALRAEGDDSATKRAGGVAVATGDLDASLCVLPVVTTGVLPVHDGRMERME